MTTSKWEDVDPRPEGSGKGGGKSKFLSLKPGEYKIRPVGNPKLVRRYFVKHSDGTTKFAVTGEADTKCIITRKYRDTEDQPLYPQRSRYAFNCFDRADGQLKIVEVPLSVARQIRDWGQENNINPGSGKGVDFKIKVIRQGSDPRNTKYEVIAGLQTPFSEDEKALIDKNGIYDLDVTFEPVDQKEIEAKLGLVAGAASASEETFAPRTQGSAPKAATAASGDDQNIDF